jgi:hypothetical protein
LKIEPWMDVLTNKKVKCWIRCFHFPSWSWEGIWGKNEQNPKPNSPNTVRLQFFVTATVVSCAIQLSFYLLSKPIFSLQYSLKSARMQRTKVEADLLLAHKKQGVRPWWSTLSQYVHVGCSSLSS